jgi:hypothetical protein
MYTLNSRGNKMMTVKGRDCSIVVKTSYREMNVPYSEETIREAVSLLQEEAAIEGDGINRAIQRNNGVTGCIVTPLTIATTPLLLYLAMGSAGLPVFISETRNLYKYQLSLLPLEDTEFFDLIQDRGGERSLYEACRVQGFELRIEREQAIKLKLDITGERYPVVYPYTERAIPEKGERFFVENVNFRINEKDYENIYGLTLTTNKENGTKTELWIRRVLENGHDLSDIIDELTFTAQLLQEKYELRHYGTFRITVNQLVLTSDETQVNTTDTVIGPLRYYVAGTVRAEVFSSSEEAM